MAFQEKGTVFGNPLREESLKSKQTFVEFVGGFLVQKKAGTVVEIGSDIQFRIASRLSRYSNRYLSVNFPEDSQRLVHAGWYEIGKDTGALKNLEVIEGDALNLSEAVPQADVIIIHNVLLDHNKGNDTKLVWQIRRGEKRVSDTEIDELNSRFDMANERAFKEFLKVAKPGYIVSFQPSDTDNEFMNFLTERLGIDPQKIERKQLLYDEDDKENWEAYIINNT